MGNQTKLYRGTYSRVSDLGWGTGLLWELSAYSLGNLQGGQQVDKKKIILPTYPSCEIDSRFLQWIDC